MITQAIHPTVNTQAKHQLLSLDTPEEWQKFSVIVNDASNDWESNIVIDGIHCAACAHNIERLLYAESGIKKVEVNASTKRARITWSETITKPSNWMFALTQAGYPALPANEIYDLTSRKKAQRLMLWRWLVAGFCMMQVMMYAYPSYIAGEGEITKDLTELLRWASWVLTLPVILFSSGPFFENAFRDIRRFQISMDLPVALGILITFIVSTAATFAPDGWWGKEVYFDSLTMFVFFLLTGRWLELRMRDRTAGALEALMRRLPQSIQRRTKNGEFEFVTLKVLNIEDVVRVLPGDAFPADGQVLEGVSAADEALLTGESKPVKKEVGDEVVAGSYNLLATVNVRITQLGQDTRYAQIVKMMEKASTEKPRLALLADRIAKPFLLGVLIAAGVAAMMFWSVDHGRALMAAVAVLIVTCPCALSLATPAAMLSAAGALAKKGVLVRRLQALEAITKIDTLVFDKTGTLTNDGLEIAGVKFASGYDESKVFHMAASMAEHSLHPISKALCQISHRYPKQEAQLNLSEIKEISGEGLIAQSNQGEIKLGSAHFCGLEQSEFEGPQVHLVANQVWLASFNFTEALKEDAVSTVKHLSALGVRTQILSGDQVSAVQNIAEKVGIQEAFGACSPEDKLKHMQELQQQGHQVAMVGDGLNDGPIMALANVSIAMGKAVPLAQAQSDFVIINNQLDMIIRLIAHAKKNMRIVKQNLLWALIYNVICIPLAVTGLLSAWLAGLGMALSSLFVVINALRLTQLPE